MIKEKYKFVRRLYKSRYDVTGTIVSSDTDEYVFEGQWPTHIVKIPVKTFWAKD